MMAWNKLPQMSSEELFLIPILGCLISFQANFNLYHKYILNIFPEFNFKHLI
jgi:hypothetical protein